MNETNSKVKDQHGYFPPLLGRSNCPEFRHLVANLEMLGVRPVRLGRKDYLLTHQVIAALERCQSDATTTNGGTANGASAVDPAEEIRARLGKRRRS